MTRRITKTVGSLVTHLFYNSQWKIVEEREGTSSSPSRISIWGIRYRDDLVRRTATFTPAGGGSPVTETAYALHDYYNVTAIVNTSGVVQERYGYTAFGETRFMAADYTPKTASTHAWDILYKAQQRDSETGFYNYGFRYYLPQLGRWPSRDPIGEYGGLNLYGFTGNNSSNRNDIYGLIITGFGLEGTSGMDGPLSPEASKLLDDLSKLDPRLKQMIEDIRASKNTLHISCYTAAELKQAQSKSGLGANGDTTVGTPEDTRLSAEGMGGARNVLIQIPCPCGGVDPQLPTTDGGKSALTILAHELQHAWDHIMAHSAIEVSKSGAVDFTTDPKSQQLETEQRAVRTENIAREALVKLGVKGIEIRTSYGTVPVTDPGSSFSPQKLRPQPLAPSPLLTNPNKT